MAIDLKELEEALRKMERRQKLYEIVKAEMIRRGRWKAANRGAAPPKTNIST